MSAHFTAQDKEDLTEIFRIYDFSKVDKVNDTVARAEKVGQTPAELFDELYQLFKIQKLPHREMVAERLRLTVSSATDADVESVIRQCEMKGFTERDALRLLERMHGIQHHNTRVEVASRSSHSGPQDDSLGEESEVVHRPCSLRHIKENKACLAGNALPAASGDASKGEPNSSIVLARPPNWLSAAPTRKNLDEVMAEEVREWLAKIVGDRFNSDVLSLPNFIDALRSGVLLHVLMQKMESPPVADEELKLPKRATGFFIRDNVAAFLTAAKTRYQLIDAQLFTVSDLVDSKNDRQVVTCLMSIARIAYSAGTIKIAPNIIVFEHEIEQQQSRLTRTDLDRIVQEAEADEGMTTLATSPDAPAEWPSSKMAPVSATASSTVQLCDQSCHFDPSHPEDSSSMRENASAQEELASPGVVIDDVGRSAELNTVTVGDQDEGSDNIGEEPVLAASSSTPPSGKTPLYVSPPPLAGDGALNTPIEDASEPRTMSSVTDAGEHSSSKNISVGAASPAAAEHGTAAAQTSETTHENTEAPGTGASVAAPSDTRGNEEEGSAGSSHVFYLRNGVILSAKPTEGKESVFVERRKKTGPRVVWKHPTSPLAATQPPRYHSRHWDGIDVALGRHLNEHYQKYHQSPWRFRTVTATAGEYVLYNRLNASRRVVFLRIIQAKLFLRNSGKHQRWVEINEALEELEKTEG
ncbi:hypothetical protein LSCM4_00528 [Leishmania orientalis]|uniref:Calponin-homology (CH) domain-containing protein n=1 Tax=Leishmania orientalis TaxID=2249476 RepID=A0A836FZZ1_9TRYP|nr:hypothetical protein LSCM4_00528 [Leishmania orientalis]